VILLRKPLLFLFVLATGASLAGGGRLSLRLLVDTATALAIIPIIQVIAFAVVYWTGRRRLTFSWAVDGFFAGSAPWFWAMLVLGAAGAASSPVVAAQWFTRLGAGAVIVAIALSLRNDFAFFTHVLGRTRQRAALDLVVQRALGWTATIAYFVASSSPKLGVMLPTIAASLFGAPL
jgi:hypothetical protein